MVSYNKLERLPATRDLFKNRITTLRGFQEVLHNSSFVAMDTEHIAITSERDRVLHQVGLAFIETMKPGPYASSISHLRRLPVRLPHFFKINHMKCLTINIKTTDRPEHEIVRIGGIKGMPHRRRHRFGQEKCLDTENLESAVVQFFQSLPRNKNLILIGFEIGVEWNYITANFPAAIPFFSAWIDLRDIAKDIASHTGVIPGLATLLKEFNYYWKDFKADRKCPGDGTADNAGDDAVVTCALAHALLDKNNQETLQFSQICEQIAHVGKRTIAHPTPEDFIATINTEGELPSRIRSGWRLASQFFEFRPLGTGTKSKDMAFLTFRSKNALDHFIESVDGMVLKTGEKLSVQRYIHIETETLEEKKLKEEKQDFRRRKKQDFYKDEFEELTDLFGRYDILCY
ncbi:hypothetical protein FBEOM_9255 [Fusarium beomiforme]|uniref:Uncharacterized protein n=1 Tax=Fusarium beomiforme TaxID=44412 RepID=A0A9P5ADR4_9HYPO|nr:hypothetical protein FBEOM_9255 [Fusarium beomiforme]